MMDLTDYYRQQQFPQPPTYQPYPGGFDGQGFPGTQGLFPGFPGTSNRLERLEREVNRLEREVERLERRLRRVERQLGY